MFEFIENDIFMNYLMIVYNNIWFWCAKETSQTFHLGAQNLCLIEEKQIFTF